MLTDLKTEVSELLRLSGQDAADLRALDGFANTVVHAGEVVVRLNDGRFRDAFRFESQVLRHLPHAIPCADVVAMGERDTGGEFLILSRLPGENLESAIPTMSSTERWEIGVQLATILKRIHELPIEPWMLNPWVIEALETRNWGNAYHAPVEFAPDLLASARAQVDGLGHLLDRVDSWLSVRLSNLPSAGPDMFVHTDFHLRNAMVERGVITGIVDFEGARIGPREMELDMLLRSVTPAEHHVFIAGMREVYPAFLDIGSIIDRLAVNEVMWQLVQLHHWRPGQTWADPVGALTRVLDGTFERQLDRLA